MQTLRQYIRLPSLLKWAVCVWVCGNETSPLFLLNWASRRHTLIISTAGTGDWPSRGWGVGSGGRQTHTHRQESQTNAHRRQTDTDAHAEINKWKQKENLKSDTLIHTRCPWETLSAGDTNDDIRWHIACPTGTVQEQSSALMRQLTFSRRGHTEGTQFQLIQQITSNYQKLIDGDI